MKFKSRVDIFNIIVYIVCLAIISTPLVVFDFKVWYCALVAIVAILMTIIQFNTSYTFLENSLKIKNGISSYEISYDSIKRVSKVKSFRFSSNTSVKSIEICYGTFNSANGNKFYVSPAKEEEFLVVLKKHCPSILEIKDKRSKRGKSYK